MSCHIGISVQILALIILLSVHLREILFLALDYMTVKARVIVTSLHFVFKLCLLWEQISIVIATLIPWFKRAFPDVL